jgi:hypothetical protein
VGAGLFGAITGILTNVGIVDASITSIGAANFVGTLVGQYSPPGEAVFSNNYATGGTVNGGVGAGSFIGGLAGQITIVTGDISNNYAKGVNASNIGAGSYVGGLVGKSVITTGSIFSNYATGNVSGSDGAASYFGGLIGQSTLTTGDIRGNYATGNVLGVTNAASYAGGLLGQSTLTTGSISGNYAAGSVPTVVTAHGGLLGGNTGGGVVGITNYWDTDTSAQDNGVTGAAPGSLITGMTTADMKIQSNFDVWDFVNTWVMTPGGVSHTYISPPGAAHDTSYGHI